MMKKKYSINSLLLLAFISCAQFASGQTTQEFQKIANSYDQDKIADFIASSTERKAIQRKEAIVWAYANGAQVEYTTADGTNMSIMAMLDVNTPLYLQTDNAGGALTIEADDIYDGGSLGLNIQGQGMTIGIWDGGTVRPTHEAFNGIAEQRDSPAALSNHSTHVAGTLVGRGGFQGNNSRGMAFEAEKLIAYDFNTDTPEMATEAGNGLLVSNHSYGIGAANLPQWYFGKYDQSAVDTDEIARNSPYWLMVCSAGNDRGAGFNTLDVGFDLLSDQSNAKNNLTVAAVNQVSNYAAPADVSMSSFSSWGPTDDGRIKPDISAKGVNMFSSRSLTDSAYGNLSGTSMSSPNVAGGMLLLQQFYNELNGTFMKSATAKALALHTANEAGDNPGPDYRFGWGLLSVRNAVDVIQRNEFQSVITETTLVDGGTYTRTVNALGNEPLVATIVWTDPAGIPLLNQIEDDVTPNLINNLDIVITDASGNSYYPWKLDPANVSAAATNTGANDVDNVEKVEIAGASGQYTISVTHRGPLQNGANQDFSIVVSGVDEFPFNFFTQDDQSTACADTETVEFKHLHNSNFSTAVTFSLTNAPAGVTATFSPATATADTDVTLTLSGLNSIAPDNYDFIVNAAGGGFSRDVSINVINAGAGTLSAPSLSFPAASATDVDINPILQWSLDPIAQEYLVEVSTSNTFTPASSIIISETVTTNSLMIGALDESVTYYWRVSANNDCSSGSFATEDFTTASLTCGNNVMGAVVPVTIPVVIASVSSTLDVPAASGGVISKVIVRDVDISHTWLGDMIITLTSPQGTQVTLMQNRCMGGDDMVVTFEDGAFGLDFGCANAAVIPNLTGTFRPEGELNDFATEDATGTWTLTVNDVGNQDGGFINGWSLEFCTTPNVVVGIDEFQIDNFVVYPNPATDQVTVSFDNVDADQVTIDIVDMLGRKVQSETFANATNFMERIDTSSFTTGVYFVRVSDGNGFVTQKLIKR